MIGQYHKHFTVVTFLPPFHLYRRHGGGWTRTPDLWMVRRVLYHCATNTAVILACQKVVILSIRLATQQMTLKLCLHWRNLLDNAGNNNSDSYMKQYLPWPPWATRQKQKQSYLCCVAQGGLGKYNSGCRLSPSLV